MLSSVCCVRHLAYKLLHACVLQLGLSAVQTSEPTSPWKKVSLQAHVPSGSARDAVSMPKEFYNKFANLKSKNQKRKSFKNESLIHSCYFGLNCCTIAVIEIATITELSTFFSYHSDHNKFRNDQMETAFN